MVNNTKYIKFSILLFLIFSININSVFSVLSNSEVQSIAQSEFEKTVPQDIRDEYLFLGIVRSLTLTEHENTREVMWTRVVNNIQVRENWFLVWIDADSGEVVDTIFNYGYPASEIDTSITMTESQASQLALQTYGGEILEFPYLEIVEKRPIWIMILKFPSGSTLKLGLDADNGETIIFSQSRGSDIQQLPTSFKPPWYQPLLLHPEYAVVAIIAIAGVSVYLIKNKKLAL